MKSSILLEELQSFSIALANLRVKVGKYFLGVAEGELRHEQNGEICPLKELDLALTSMTYLLTRTMASLKNREEEGDDVVVVKMEVESEGEEEDGFPLIDPESEEEQDPLAPATSFIPVSRRGSGWSPVVMLKRLDNASTSGSALDRDGSARHSRNSKHEQNMQAETEDDEQEVLENDGDDDWTVDADDYPDDEQKQEPSATEMNNTSKSENARVLIKCPIPTCVKKLLGRSNWLTHIRNIHRPEYERNPNIIFADKEGNLVVEKGNEKVQTESPNIPIGESSRQQMKCLIPGCDKVLLGPRNWLEHLRRHHRQEFDKNRDIIIIPQSKAMLLRQKDAQEENPELMNCPVPDCKEKLLGRAKWLNHLLQTHAAEYKNFFGKNIPYKKNLAVDHVSASPNDDTSAQSYLERDLIKCPITTCGKELLGRKNWRTHIRYMHSVEYKENPQIAELGIKKPDLPNLSIVEKPRNEAGDFMCPVPQCGWTGRKKVTTNNHLKETHPDFLLEKYGIRVPLYKIPLKYRGKLEEEATPEEIEKAQRKAEEEKERYRKKQQSVMCSVCGLILSSEKNLKRHSMTHKNSRKHVCMFCGARYKTNSVLYSHLRVHTLEKPFSCDVCGLRFTWEVPWRRHISLANCEAKEGHLCFTCGMTLRDASALMLHVEKFHSNEPAHPFSCDKCDKTFKRRIELNLHSRQH